MVKNRSHCDTYSLRYICLSDPESRNVRVNLKDSRRNPFCPKDPIIGVVERVRLHAPKYRNATILTEEARLAQKEKELRLTAVGIRQRLARQLYDAGQRRTQPRGKTRAAAYQVAPE